MSPDSIDSEYSPMRSKKAVFAAAACFGLAFIATAQDAVPPREALQNAFPETIKYSPYAGPQFSHPCVLG